MCEEAGNTIGVSKKNKISQSRSTNTCYRSYAASTRAIIKTLMSSPQEYDGVTHYPGVPGRDQITGFPRIMRVSHIATGTVDVWQSYSI